MIDVLAGLTGVRKDGSGWTAQCPAHADSTASLHVSRGEDRWLIWCFAGCGFDAIAAAMGMTPASFFDERPARQTSCRRDHAVRLRPDQRITASFEFSRGGRLHYRTHRIEPGADNRAKDFAYDHRDAAGEWRPGRGPADRVPYRLDELAVADPALPVFFAEGESKADRLASWGLVATSSKHWRAEFAPLVKGRTCVILPDNDEPGRNIAADIARKMTGAARVLTVDLPGLPEGGDVLDWHGDRAQLELLVAATCSTGDTPKPDRSTNGALEASEDAIASAFTAQYGTTMRFDHDAGCWFRWDGTRWRRDRTDVALDFARRLARAIGESKRALCKASVAAGAERFARADRVHAIESAHWDRDHMLLGTPAGTVDLRTGLVRSADPSDLITKQTSAAVEAGEPALWLRFLEEALAGDQETIRFLQQWAGYCLTGDTREHALAFVYGPGGNGKTVFLNTLMTIVGDYAATAAMECFTASHSDRHSTELAMLRGARLVTSSETEEGRAWAEARIKQITGGDPITARFMRQDNFTFRPQFKLVIAGNHAPALRSVDDAMRRRFSIVPFLTTPLNPDRLLEQKLKKEHGRILSWAVAGCLDWQANGLVRPQAVSTATADYFENEDLFGQWLIDRCESGVNRWELPARLYSSWAEYCRAAGDVPGTQRSLSGQLKRRGFTNAKSNGLRIYRGLSLKAEGPSHE